MKLEDIQSMTNHLLTSSAGFLRITFLREAQAKLFFQTFRQGRRYFRAKDQTADSQLRIERDISIHERIERQPLLALVDVLTKEATESGSPLFENYLRTDLNTLQLWSPDEDSTLIAMVIYTKQADSVSCLLALLPQHRTHIISHFPRYFIDRMCQTIRFLQAYQNSIRHSTTTARFHYSQTMDITNIANTEAIRFFPYEVFPVDLTNDLQQQLQNDPGSLLASYQGLQPLIHQAMQDHNIDPADYGKGARGKERNKGSKGFGKPSSKGKRNDTPASKGRGKQRQDDEWFPDWQQQYAQTGRDDPGAQVGNRLNLM